MEEDILQLPTSFLKSDFRTEIGSVPFISAEQLEQDVKGDILRQQANFSNMASELQDILDLRKDDLSSELRNLLIEKIAAANEVASRLEALSKLTAGFGIREDLFEEYHKLSLEALTVLSFEEVSSSSAHLNALARVGFEIRPTPSAPNQPASSLLFEQAISEAFVDGGVIDDLIARKFFSERQTKFSEQAALVREASDQLLNQTTTVELVETGLKVVALTVAATSVVWLR